MKRRSFRNENPHFFIRYRRRKILRRTPIGGGKMNVRRGELYYADLSPVVGSEQGGIRTVLVVQNDIGNRYSPTVIAAAVTSKLNKARLPTHIELNAATYGLQRDSVVLLEQIRTLDKRRLKERIGMIETGTMQRVDAALLISLGFSMAEESRADIG